MGIIIAHGNIGKGLNSRTAKDLNTFITVDGGIRWRKLEDGINNVLLLEKIGILVLAPVNTFTNEI